MLEVHNLSIIARVEKDERYITRGVSFSLDVNERLAITGRSGCGKTMTAMALLGILPPNCHAEGSVLFDGLPLAASIREKRGRDIVYIPQSGADFLNPSLKIKTQMHEAAARAGIPKVARKSIITTALTAAGFRADACEGILAAYSFQLSGGMAQRVVMAMASLPHPRLVIADEPTRGIDRDGVALFINNIETMFAGAGLIIITHDASVAAICSKQMELRPL
jgi:ABC-type glutathione transport system ATPase component